MSPENNPIYSPEQIEKQHLELSPEQENEVRAITLGIEEVDERVREMAVEDVVQTLENGHPLNKIITNKEGKTSGYIACEDFVPHEAYIKYFGTNGGVGRNLFKEVPAFFEYAKEQGYTKLNFHGWNKRLNHVLEHFGFERIRTDSMGEFSADYYEKSLGEQKTPEEISAERARAFEQKYLAKLAQDYEKTLKTFSAEEKPAKEQNIAQSYQTLSTRLASTEGFDFNDRAQAVLKLKLARHFQNNDSSLDLNTLYDALIETPKFLDSDKGKLSRLFEVHEQKTLQKIAEIRRARAEMTGNETFNPYEALYQTKSGKYYMAHLLNMPHLQEESAYMDHCVGTSDSYINQMKRGDIEILSFRNLPQLNPETHQLEGKDTPIITLEYNIRANTIEQMKKKNDEYLHPEDPYFNDFIEALKMLRQTETDTGKPRNFKKIAKSELENIRVSKYCVLTDQGEIPFREFNPDSGAFILKTGEMTITPEMNKSDIAKISRIIEDIKVDETEIALNPNEISENTKLYIGPFSVKTLQLYPNLEYYYTSFPENKITRGEFTTEGKTGLQKQSELEVKEIKISEFSKSMLQSPEFIVAKAGEKITTVRLKVRDLFSDENSHTYSEIVSRANELDLDLLPHETAADMLLSDDEKNQPRMDEWFTVVSEKITGRDGSPNVFSLHRDGGGLWLYGLWTYSTDEWDPGDGLILGLRNVSQES